MTLQETTGKHTLYVNPTNTGIESRVIIGIGFEEGYGDLICVPIPNSGEEDFPQAVATAQRIVTAWNAHDDLLAALEDIAAGNGVPDDKLLLPREEFMAWCVGHLQGIARAAIAKARGAS